MVPWPIHIEGLTREIEGALRMSAHITRRAGTLQLALLPSSIHPSAWKGVCDVGGWTLGAVLSARLRRTLATAYGASGWFHRRGRGTMSVVVEPSARETFTPRELAAAYQEFLERGPQYLDAETGLSASAYRFGERVLLVYEESETGLVVLTHPRS